MNKIDDWINTSKKINAVYFCSCCYQMVSKTGEPMKYQLREILPIQEYIKSGNANIIMVDGNCCDQDSTCKGMGTSD